VHFRLLDTKQPVSSNAAILMLIRAIVVLRAMREVQVNGLYPACQVRGGRPGQFIEMFDKWTDPMARPLFCMRRMCAADLPTGSPDVKRRYLDADQVATCGIPTARGRRICPFAVGCQCHSIVKDGKNSIYDRWHSTARERRALCVKGRLASTISTPAPADPNR